MILRFINKFIDSALKAFVRVIFGAIAVVPLGTGIALCIAGWVTSNGLYLFAGVVMMAFTAVVIGGVVNKLVG